jgi:hypothetical protein
VGVIYFLLLKLAINTFTHSQTIDDNKLFFFWLLHLSLLLLLMLGASAPLGGGGGRLDPCGLGPVQLLEFLLGQPTLIPVFAVTISKLHF